MYAITRDQGDFLSLAGVSVRRMSKLVRPASHVMTSALDTYAHM